MSQRATSQRQLAWLERLVSGAVDCVLEARNNVARAEWDFAEANLRALFRNAGAMTRHRRAILRFVREARKGGKLK